MSSRWARGDTRTSSTPATTLVERASPSTSWRYAVSGPIGSTPRRSVGMRYPALTSESGPRGMTAIRAVRVAPTGSTSSNAGERVRPTCSTRTSTRPTSPAVRTDGRIQRLTWMRGRRSATTSHATAAATSSAAAMTYSSTRPKRRPPTSAPTPATITRIP